MLMNRTSRHFGGTLTSGKRWPLRSRVKLTEVITHLHSLWRRMTRRWHRRQQIHDELDQGQWLIIQPREIVATFFLALPEPLAFPQGRASQTLLPIGVRQ